MTDRTIAVSRNFHPSTANARSAQWVTEPEIWIYDTTGRRIRTIAVGAASNTVDPIEGICVAQGDTLFVGQRDRLSFLPPGADSVTSVLARPSLFSDSDLRTKFGCLSDGSVVIVDPAATVLQGMRSLVAVKSDGKIAHHFGTVAYSTSVQPMGLSIFLLDRRRSEFPLLSDSGPISRVIRTDDTVAIRTEAMPRPPTAAEMLANPSLWHEIYAEPFYNQAVTDGKQRLWVQDYSLPPSPRWVAIDAKGRILGALILPSPRGFGRWEIVSFAPAEIEIRRVGGIGEQYLEFYRVFPLGPQ